jgi:oligogalacturonide transporter
MIAVFALFMINQNIPIWALLIVGAFVGLGLSGCVMTPYNMLAFVVDADEMITTKRREGIYAGMMTFMRKIAQAVALFLVGVGLEAVNYQEPINDVVQTQTPETLLGIRLMFLLGPVVLLTLGIISSFRYKISPNNHEILMSEISRLKAGGSKTDVASDHKQIIESITGQDYQSLWKKEGVNHD